MLVTKQEPQKLVIPAQAAVQNLQELSPKSIAHSCLWVKFKPPQNLGPPSQEVPDDRLSRDGVRPKESTCLDIYVLDGKGSRLIQLNPKHSDMLSQAGNLLFIIKLCNLKEKYGTPFVGVDRITSDLYAMEANSMTLIFERATIVSWVSTSTGVSPQYPSQVFSPPSVADNALTLLAAESTWVPQVDRMVIGNEERGAIGGTPLSITSCSSSTSTGLANIDLTQEMLMTKTGRNSKVR